MNKLKAIDVELIFATTTPVVPGILDPLRIEEAVVRYNKAALGVMKRNEIPVNDLYALMLPNLTQWQLPKSCHFKLKGCDELAKQIAKRLEDALAK